MKIKAVLIILALLICTSVFSCKKTKNENSITVGATPEPHAEMLLLVKDELKNEGYDLKVREFTDYITPNEALESGEIDANFFQHLPYLNSFNKDRGFHLVNAGAIHIEPLALYSKKFSTLQSIKDLRSIKEIAIPNDPTNEGRALLLLQSAGLITLKDNAGLEATVSDIQNNPYSLRFKEIEAATLPRILNDVDCAVINGNYAIPAGLKANVDGLFVEGADSPYVNVIAVKDGHQNDAKIKALVKALKSEKVATYLSEKYKNGEVVLVK